MKIMSLWRFQLILGRHYGKHLLLHYKYGKSATKVFTIIGVDVSIWAINDLRFHWFRFFGHTLLELRH